MEKYTKEDLKRLQSLSLEEKVDITLGRIMQWYNYWKGNVYVSYSGGKDSTVLLHLVRSLYPDVPAVYVNTGLEYPEIQAMVREQENATILTPEMPFVQVLTKYGYPLISKEVSECIYYARRNVGKTPPENEPNSTVSVLQTMQTSRNRTGAVPRERDSTADTVSASRKNSWEGDPQQTRGTHGTESGRRERIQPQRYRGGGQHETESHGNLPKPLVRNKGVHYRRRQFTGVAPTGTTGGERSSCLENSLSFSKSIFNKEKWLPLARDLPVRISHKCCDVMKKSPMKKYVRANKSKPIIGTMTEESRLRKQSWLRHGCNAFDGSNPSSQPMSFWTEQDVLAYIVSRNLDLAKVYGDIVYVDKDGFEYPAVMDGSGCKLKTTGCQRTGCVYCPFGMHLEKGETRIQRLAKTHPKQYDFCMRGGQWIDNPDFDPTDTGEPDEIGWVNWNPPKLWVPGNGGLGMAKVFDMVNEIYGEDFYRYK